MKKHILFLHKNFPGQFRRIAAHWAKDPNYHLLGIGRKGAPGMQSIQWLQYEPHRAVRKEHIHPYLEPMENAVLHGQAVARILLQLKNKGYRPDVVFAHPGWGDSLYVKEVFPDTRVVHFCEWYYGTPESEIGFDAEFPPHFDTHTKLATWNALHALNLINCDVAISPTEWQRSRHPAILQSKIQLIHEGVDTERLGPDANASITLPSGVTLRKGDPVITYVARNLEPYRGFHVMMRALEKIQRQHPTCHMIIVGGDDVSYGSKPKDALNWREKMLKEVKIDPQRTHFMGKVPYAVYCTILQVSAAHLYLSYPFVLSWSMLEAMATACLLIGSRTRPVEEALTHQHTGLLVDFFDTEQICQTVIGALTHPEQYAHLRKNARAHAIANYSFAKGEQAYRNLLHQLLKPQGSI